MTRPEIWFLVIAVDPDAFAPNQRTPLDPQPGWQEVTRRTTSARRSLIRARHEIRPPLYRSSRALER